MNAKTAKFKEKLSARGMTIEGLAKAAKINPCQLSLVLAERREGRFTWPRIEGLIDAEERQLIVELYGPVFGEEAIAA